MILLKGGFNMFWYSNDSVPADLILISGWFYNPEILLAAVTALNVD